MDVALDLMKTTRQMFSNHNLETARLYTVKLAQVRTTSGLLICWRKFKSNTQTSQLNQVMMGLGETKEEIVQVLKDLREHGVTMLTLGQYFAFQPSSLTSRTLRAAFRVWWAEKEIALDLGFTPPLAMAHLYVLLTMLTYKLKVWKLSNHIA